MQKVLDVSRTVLSTALIFDMDGVLVDESQSYRNCIVKTAEYFLGKRSLEPISSGFEQQRRI